MGIEKQSKVEDNSRKSILDEKQDNSPPQRWRKTGTSVSMLVDDTI
ncbi:hypothetical protein FOXG_17911 [Fusarium oxysporum f. sp. lycopersici 4287]|uniref:Uncharacterized protein n=3 Tax=Fusarium oxysporum TaxID=5507 RepID=W9IJS3_FUSOX|nr:hypothetical protein FOXG_17911 [Fusarium oxysporum f. sp. lycopersici 4287]EWY93540.1 hypothetical protein FOYG_06704 [Fusarium oxysporum NRRL 32931]EXK48406.1 hypothetical protein FOMG_01355 [Fusarium oxysporum f. sp. melonis 26406]KNA94727.1 hypothetical protein FOXG_17911 [Fusarium oxysporum f. sp. lycopersici 4287]